MTSRTPGSPPIPSTVTNAYLLSGEITTPWETFVVLSTILVLPVLRFLISVFPSPFNVVTSFFPSEVISILYGPFPVLNLFIICQESVSTSIISLEELPAI